MTDKKDSEQNDKADKDMEHLRQPITVHAQYIKDLSVENPHAPLSLRSVNEHPVIEMSVNVNAREIEEKENDKKLHEVVLSVSVTAKQSDQVAMIIEMDYGLACTVHEIAKEQMHPFLLIEVPHMMFPFVRQIVADLTAHAGFSPLYLTPVNFRTLYMQRFAKGATPPPTEGEEEQKAAG